MSASSQDPRSSALENAGKALNRLESAGTRWNPPEFSSVLTNRLNSIAIKVLAAETQIDDSLVSKFIRNAGALKLTDVSKLVRAAELKAVDLNRRCVRPDELAYLRGLYARVNDQAPWLLDEDEA